MMRISGPKGNKTRTIAQCWKILQGGRPLLEEKSQDSGGLLQSTWVEGSSRAVVVSRLTEPPAYARIIPLPLKPSFSLTSPVILLMTNTVLKAGSPDT